MSKILIIATSPKTHGGITSVINSLKQGEQWNDNQCIWISSHIDGGPIVKLITLVSGLLKYLIQLPSADIVHIHVSEPLSAKRKLLFFRLARLRKKKVIVHFHSFSPDTTINGRFSNRYRELFSGANAVIVLSNYWKQVVNDKYDLGEKVRVIYNPCATSLYNGEYQKENRILYAGALNQRKGYSDLIKAFAIIAEKHAEWKITLAGNGEIEKAKDLALTLGIKNQVETPGWINGETKDKVFKQAKIFCLPSYAEGFPMAVLDAWAYSLPVITTPVGGIPDVAKDGENMLLFEPGDIKKLAECLDLLISDEILREKLARESVKFANTTFNIDTFNHQVFSLYEELMN